MTLYYVFSSRGVIPAERYTGEPDVGLYRKLLVRALFVVLQPFGYTKQFLESQALGQTTLPHYQEEPEEVSLEVFEES